MFSEISTKSAIFFKTLRNFTFFAKCVCAYSPRGAAGAFGASIRAPAALVWRALWRSFDAPFLTPSARAFVNGSTGVMYARKFGQNAQN